MKSKIHTFALAYLEWFTSIWNAAGILSLEEAEKYLAREIHLYVNGILKADNINAYLERVKTLRETLHLEIELPVRDIVVDENKVAINYLENHTYKDGSHKQLAYVIVVHFDTEGKIIQLYNIFNEVGYNVLSKT